MESKPQEVVALECLVLLLYQQFGFGGFFGNHSSDVLGSILWQSGSVDSLLLVIVKSLSHVRCPYSPRLRVLFLPILPHRTDYHVSIFRVSVNVNILSLGQF